jgi:hypothetical protein
LIAPLSESAYTDIDPWYLRDAFRGCTGNVTPPLLISQVDFDLTLLLRIRDLGKITSLPLATVIS